VEVPEWEEPEKILLLLLFLLCFVKFIMEEFEYVIVEEKNLGKQEKKKRFITYKSWILHVSPGATQ